MWNGGIAPLILNLGARWKWVVNITLRPLCPQEITSIPIQDEARWETKSVFTKRRGEIFLAPVGFWTPGRPPKPCHHIKKIRKLQKACVSLQHANLNFNTFNMANVQLNLRDTNNRKAIFQWPCTLKKVIHSTQDVLTLRNAHRWRYWSVTSTHLWANCRLIFTGSLVSSKMTTFRLLLEL